MTIIDTVPAGTLEAGDIIRFIVDGEDLGLQEVKRAEEDGTDEYAFITVASEQDDEMYFPLDFLVDIYGYTDSED